MHTTDHASSSRGSPCHCCGCDCGQAPQRGAAASLSRRQWLGATIAAGGAALSTPLWNSLQGAESAETAAAPATPKAKILRLYSQEADPRWDVWSRPNDRPWLKTDHAAVEKHLAALAQQIGGVQFVGPDRPLDPKQALELAAGLAKQVDGVLVFSCDNVAALAPVLDFGLPTVAFNITCHAFDPHSWERKRRLAKNGNDKLLVLSSRDFSELDRGVRLLRVPGMLKHSRLLVVGPPAGDAETRDYGKIKAQLGVEAADFAVDDVHKVFRAIDPKLAAAEAEAYWRKPARKVDARPEDVVGAARFQLALRRIMASQRAQAIAINCLGALTAPRMDEEGYPCLGFSALEDEGWVTSCQCDIDCALSKMILRCAFNLPSFLGNIYFDTGKQTVILDHCTGPTKMGGVGAPRLPFDLLTHHTNTGAAPRVFMPVGETVTVARIVGLKGLLFYAAKVTGNPEGTCRTTYELAPIGDEKTPADHRPVGACAGLHRVACVGDRVRDLKDLCALLGTEHHPTLA